jgi:maltose O-acetyltransferase
MIRHFINIILYFLPPSRLFILRKFLLSLAKVNLGKNVSFCGLSWIYGRGNLLIGDSTWISPGAVFHTHEDAQIKIGKFCDIGPGSEFIIGSHRIGGQLRRGGEGIASDIVVGDGTWIGAKVLILDGVSIGSGCVIAAGSVVNKDVDNNCLVAGVPAKVKRNLEN